MSNHIQILANGVWTIPLLGEAEVKRLLRLTQEIDYQPHVMLVGGHQGYQMVFSRIVPFLRLFGQAYLPYTPQVENVFPFCSVRREQENTAGQDWHNEEHPRRRLKVVVKLNDGCRGGQLQVRCEQGRILAPLDCAPVGTAAVFDNRLDRRVLPVQAGEQLTLQSWLMSNRR